MVFLLKLAFVTPQDDIGLGKIGFGKIAEWNTSESPVRARREG
jgi:hypothetical protein